MKIIFNNSFYEFHKDFIKCIKLEIEKRNGILIITDCCENTSLTAKQIENIYIELHSDANFTILPDEACRVIGGIGIYINHAIPVVPQNKFYYSLNLKDKYTKMQIIYFFHQN